MGEGPQEEARNQAPEVSPASLRQQCRRLQYGARKEAKAAILQHCLLNQQETMENVQPHPPMDQPGAAHVVPVIGEGPPLGNQEPRQVRTFLPFLHALSSCIKDCSFFGLNFFTVPQACCSAVM
jgi:hypothetical protein